MLALGSIGVAGLAVGCASFSADGGMDDVAAWTKERTGETPQRINTDRERSKLDKTVSDLLAGPLTADSAVQIALINNPRFWCRQDACAIPDFHSAV